ncbi:MAG: nickel pincer cofactor biosynthesis protein LarB [Candidatus Ratteibacteria bacterium]|nr:nickel pincer cofactor biosynthesis protein LarB [Candidatus Ratteibacteria bacterium]
MDQSELTKILNSVKSGKLTIEKAIGKLKSLPYQDLGFAKIDTHRSLRRGFHEVIFCEGKTIEQIKKIVAKTKKSELMVARATPQVFKAIKKIIPEAVYFAKARIVAVKPKNKPTSKKSILVITAGTADIPVAEEAAVTAELMGNKVERLYDVGVAGIHRLLNHQEKLSKASVLIVVAGMEGALPSVVGGLVDKPVIAVPTSIGYGASFEGLAALLAMLNCCSPGIAVVNIDNGFGAGYFASLINKK